MKDLTARKVYYVLVILLGLVSLITCEQDYVTGLGSSVDTSQPVVKILTNHGTGPGTFLTGKKRIYIDANDDLELNSVTVVYTYYYIKDGKPYPMEVAVNAFWSDKDGCYVIDIDTLNGFYDEQTKTWLPMVDGPLAAIIIATDQSGKRTVTPEIIYTVKNGPPKVTMQIPRPRTRNDELLNEDPFPTVVQDNYFMGVYEDLAGLAPGYPLIKFWEAGKPEPADYKENAGWENVIGYNSPGNGWIRPDEGVAESNRGEKGGSFRYFLRKRQFNGKPFDVDTKNGLTPDRKYNLKIKAVDINGIALEWPRDVYPNSPEYMTMFMDAEGKPPIVTIVEPDQEKLYFRDDFNIIAEAECQGDLSTEISELRFEVVGKDRNTVLLKSWEYPEIKNKSQGKFPIELGKTYYSMKQNEIIQSAIKVDKESDVPGGAFSQVTFSDGSFTFNIHAYDDVGARKTVTFSIYVDKQPPVTSVTSVSPYYTQDKTTSEDNSNGFENKPYRRWTVNKTVKIAVSSTDNRGEAIDSDTDYAKLKYVFSKGSDISSSAYNAWKGSDPAKTFERYLYEASGAKYLDAVKANPVQITSGTPNGNPLEFVEGKDGSYTLWLQTHKYAADVSYKLWMYIIAMDNADNISFDKILLNVDQETDNPKIEYTEINTFMNDKSYIRLTVDDDNGLSDVGRKDIPKVYYRFAKNISDRNTLNAQPENGWKQVYDWKNNSWNNILSEDVKRITINDLTLKKIALDLGLTGSDADLKEVLGAETDVKYFQIRAIDNENTKVYKSDGEAASTTEWREFTMDLTIPVIHVSEKELNNNNLTLTGRNPQNPFGIPEKNRAYKNMPFIYGDIIEENLSSISVKIDGDNTKTITYTILEKNDSGKDGTKFSVIYDGKPSTIDSAKFYVWKNKDDKNSKRWYIPRADFNDLEDGPHTFEISFEDKVPQVTSMSLTFYKDTKGPVISFANPGGTDTLTSAELTKFNKDLEDGASLNYSTSSGFTAFEIYNRLTVRSIKDMSAKLSGTFTDDYSPIAGDTYNKFWWKIDEGGWQEESITISEDKAVSWEVPLTKIKGGAELDDGVHILSIRVKDSLGNGSDSDYTVGGLKTNMAFLIDKSVPELLVTDYPKKPINNTSTFKGKITKTNKVKQLSVKLGNDEIATIDVESGDVKKFPIVNGNKYGVDITLVQTPGVGKSFDFTATINPSVGGLEDGPKSLMFSAVGSSGQSGMTTSSFTLDTKGPSIAIGAPISDSVYVTNSEWGTLKNAVFKDDFSSASSVDSIYNKVFAARIKDGSPSFAVTFTDEASSVFESGNNKYWYKFENDDENDSGSEWLEGTITSDNFGKTSVSINLPLPADKRKDGVHRVSIRATDSLGNGYDKLKANTAPEKDSGVGYQSNLVFMIDTGVPVLVVKNDNDKIVPSAEAADFGIHKSSFNINGTITGTFDVQDLSVKIGSTVVAQRTNGGENNNITWTPKPNGKRTYNFSNVKIDPLSGVTDGSKDGSYTVSVSVKGSSEQSVMSVSTVTLDTQGPKITINAPIKEKIYLDNTQRGYISKAISDNDIDSLKSKPFISDSTTTTLEKKYYDLLRYNVKDASSMLSGSFADTYLDIGDNYWYKFNDGAWETGTTKFTNAGNKKSADWEIDLSKLPNGAPRTLPDGMNRLSIRVKDALSNGYGDFGATPPDNSGGNGYESDLNFILDAGTPKFGIVNGLADVSEGKEPDVKGPPDFFTVSGRITGTFMVKRLGVSIGSSATVILTADGTQTNQNGDPYINTLTLTPVANEPKTFDYSFNVYTVNGFKPLEYGARTITINAVGSSDNSEVKTLSFIFDNQGPKVTVSVPSSKLYMSSDDKNSLNDVLDSGASYLPGQEDNYKKLDAMVISDASAVLSGTFNDDYSPVASKDNNTFWWNIDNSPTWSSGNLAISNNKSVNWVVPISDLQVGVHILSIRVKDSLGNGFGKDSTDVLIEGGNGYETNIAFLIDKNPPKITGLSVPKDALKGEFTVTGKVTETYGVKKLSIKLGNDEIAVAEKNGSGNFDVTNLDVKGVTYGKGIKIERTKDKGKSFDFTAFIDPISLRDNPNGQQDGPKSLTFTAIGSSNQAAIGVDSFTLDTTGPKVAIGAPISESIYITNDDWSILKGAVDGDNFSSAASVGSIYDKVFAARIKDNAASFTVTFTDDASPVFKSGKNNTYWYRLDDAANWTPVTIDDVNLLGQQSVSVKLPLPSGGKWLDSVHRVSIRVTDSLGNGYDDLNGNNAPATPESGAGYQSNLLFMIDSGKPTLIVDNPNLGTFKASDKISISGTITGTFKVQELNAKIGDYAAIINASDIHPLYTYSKKSYKFDNVFITPISLEKAIGNTEGSYTISVTAKGSSEQTDMKTSTFILDTKGPTISINAPIKEKIYLTGDERSAIDYAILHNNTKSMSTGATAKYYDLLRYNVKDIAAGLSGSFADTYSDIGNQYWYKFNDDTSWTPVNISGNKKSVDWQIPLTGLTDGLNRLSIRVQDTLSNGYNDIGVAPPDNSGGNGYESNITFMLDTAPPVFSAVDGISEGNEPDVKGPSSDIFTVSGQITGTYLVKRLSVSLGGGNVVILTEDELQRNQSGGDPYINTLILKAVENKKQTFDYSFNVDVTKGTPLAYGSRTITINAIGSSDQSSVKTLSFIYDNKGPNVSVSIPSNKVYMSDDYKDGLNSALISGAGLTTDQQKDYNSFKTALITDSSTKLSGTFNDEYSAVANDTNKTFWYKIDDLDWQDGTLTASTEKSVSWEVPISGLGEGVHLLSLRAKDKWGNGYAGNTTPDGNGGQGFENNIAFMIDRSVPELKITKAPDIPIKSAFTFEGKITNTYGVKRLSVKLGSDEIASIQEGQTGIPGITLSPTPGNGRSFDFTVTIDPKDLKDGPISLAFNAIGSSGQVAMVTSSFTHDTKGPTITIGAPISESVYVTDTEWLALKKAVDDDYFAGVSSAVNDIYDKVFDKRIKDNAASFTVTFTDDFSSVFAGEGKDNFWYRLDDNTDWIPVLVNDLNKQSVSIKLSLLGIGEKWTDGVHRLSIRASDSLGNGYNNSNGNDAPKTKSGEGYQSNLVFMIDSGIPVLTFNIDKPESKIINTSTPLEISGTIKGTYEVQDMSVKISSTPVVINPTDIKRTANKKKEYSFKGIIIDPTVISTATGGKEGSYTISVTVKGSSDQSVMNVSTFILDTQGPKISVNSPIKEKIYMGDNKINDINKAIEANGFDLPEHIAVKDDFYKLLKNSVKDASMGISGSFTDMYSGVENQYWYNFNGGEWLQGTTKNNSGNSADWQIELPLQTIDNVSTIKLPNGQILADGINQLSIRVKDVRGNGYDSSYAPTGSDSGDGYETSLTFILDTSAPEIATISGLISDGEVKGPTNDGYFTVNGTISNTFLVKRFSITLLGPQATILEFDDKGVLAKTTASSYIKNASISPAGEKTYSFSFNVLNVDNGKSLDYGSRSITINAIGSSDQSGLKILSFIYDDKGPKVTVNAPLTEKLYLTSDEWTKIDNGSYLLDTDLTAKYNSLGLMGIKDASNGLNGYFNDDHSAVGEEFWYKFLNVDGAKWTKVTITNTANSKSVAWNIPLTDPINPGSPTEPKYLVDGTYRVSIRVKDSLGNGYGTDPQDDTAINKLPNFDIDPNNNKNNGPGHETELAFLIDMGIPEISDFKLVRNEVELPSTNIFLNGDFVITGTIKKTVAVKKLTAKIGTKVITADTTVPGSNLTQIGDKWFEFKIPVSPEGLGLVENSYSLQVTVTGSSDQSSMETSNFTYDVTPPSASFNSPVVGVIKKDGNGKALEGKVGNIEYSIWLSESWETGEIKVGGVADDKYGVDRIYYRLGKINDNSNDADSDASRIELYSDDSLWTPTNLHEDSPAQKWSGGLYYWNYLENMNPYLFAPSLIDKATGLGGNTFYLPFYVKVVDRAGNINVVQYKVYVDPDRDIPGAKIVSPSDNVSVGGEIRITGTANDNNWVHSVEIRIKDTVRGTYYKNPEDEWCAEDEHGKWVKAKIAGNTDTVVSWYYSINGDGSLNPEPGTLGRLVYVSVRARDTKDALHEIPDKVSLPIPDYNYTFDSGVPTISVPIISKTGNEDRKYTDGIRVSGTFIVSADVKDDGGISSIRARLTGDSKFTDIVKDGVKAASLPAGWQVTVPNSVSTWQGGWRYYITDPGNISNWNEIDLDYTLGKTYVKGTTIKYNGVGIDGSGWAMKADGERANTDTDTNPNSTNWNSQSFKYPVEFEIDSTAVQNLGYGKTGIFTLELDVYDNNKEPAPYNTKGTFNFGVDNYYPTAEITTQFNATTEKFYLMGTAKDYDGQSGTQMGIARILVYFEKNGTFYNARALAAGTADPFYNGKGYTDSNNKDWSSNGVGRVSYPDVMDRDTNKDPLVYKPNVNTFANFPYLKSINKGSNLGEVLESPHAMVIDGQEIGETVDTDRDGTYAEQLEGKADITWQALLDTTKFVDGPIIVHYVIMDQAGNATHYSDKIYIGNNKPLIREINLGTDINGDGNVTGWTSTANPGEYLKNSISIGNTVENNTEKTTNFRVRNNRFSLRLDALYGNTQKHYKVSYVTRGALVKSTEMERGKVYTIASASETEAAGYNDVAGGNTDWTKYGAISNNSGTTFVASGAARDKNDKGNTTTGYAWEYTEYADTKTYKKGDFRTNNAIGDSDKEADGKVRYSDLVYTGIFTDFTHAQMGDTITKKYNANGNMVLMNDKRFIVKVYDSTDPDGDETDQLAHVALLNVDFDNNDTQKPLIVINPFFWNSLTDNSVYESEKIDSELTNVQKRDELKGHIELGSDLPVAFNQLTGINDRDPKVSGKVSFRGTAYDNILIKNIYFSIDKHGTSNYGVDSATVAGGTYYPAASFNNNNLTNTNNFNANGWKFTVTKETLDQDGHSIEWQLDYDSSFVTNVVSADVNLKVVAQDSKPTPSDTPNYQFDVVPYITKVVTALSGAYGPQPSAFNRSALGRYPVRSGETITIQGFNLVPTTGLVSGTQVTVGTVDITTTDINGSSIARSGSDINVKIGTNIDSGYLSVRVGTISSINNSNDSGKEYNKEPNGVNNNNLNDDRYLYVWNTGYLMNLYPGLVRSPFFRMGADGRRYMTFGSYDDNGRWRVSVDNTFAGTTTSGTPAHGFIEYQNNRYLNMTIAVDQAGSWYAGGTNMTSTGTNAAAPNFTFFARTAGAQQNNNAGGDNKRRILSINNNGVWNENRVKTPRIYAYQGGSSGQTINHWTYTAAGHGLTVGDYVMVSNTLYSVIYVNGNQFRLAAPGGTTGLNLGNNTITVYRAVRPTGRSNTSIPTGWIANGYYYIFDANYGFVAGDQITGYYITDNVTATAYARNVGTINGQYCVQFTTGANNSTIYTPSQSGPTLYIFTQRQTFTTASGVNVQETSNNAAVGTNANATRIFMSYYDSNSSDNPVVFRYGLVGDNNNFGGDLGYASGDNYNSTGGDTSTWGSFGGNSATTVENYRQVVANNSTTHRGSDYTAVGGLSNGRPVIAWYDNFNQRLVFSYGNGTPTTTAVGSATSIVRTATGNTSTPGTWQGNAAIVDTFKGTHVDMAVDGGDNVHLAYYDVGNGGLYYAFIPYTTADNGRPDTSKIQKVKVDTYLTAGTKLMINVRQENIGGVDRYVPYISYYHGSFTETKNAIRVAWRKDFTNDPVTNGIRPGTNADDSFTGAWEVMTIPVKEVPLTSEFICNGVPTGSSWTDPSLASGVANVPALTRGSVDLRSSVVVGYMTNQYYEGAMLKGKTSD